jgi:hypothetical protein
MAVERERARLDVARFETMLRDPERSREYWRSPALQSEYGAAIERSLAVEAATSAGAIAVPGSPTRATPPGSPAAAE